MKRNLFTAWTVIAVLALQQTIIAGMGRKPAQPARVNNSALLEAGAVFTDPATGTKIIRVTDAADGQVTVARSARGSSFNANSTRLFLSANGAAVLYSFNPSSLKIQKEGPLFDGLELTLDNYQWSASEADVVFGLDDSAGQVRIFSRDVQSSSYALLKDFSTALLGGEARRLSKSEVNDNRFAFLWRESGAQEWRYAVVWDRQFDNAYFFDITDPVSGMAGFKTARLDKAGNSLIVDGNSTLVWQYATEQQWEAIRINEPDSGLVTSSESGPEQDNDFDMVSALSGFLGESLNEKLPRSNTSSDGRFSIFTSSLEGSRNDVFVATMTPQAAAETVIWTHIINCTALENTLQKTGGTDSADDARATSMQSITSGDGYVEFTVKEKGKEVWCGLNSGNHIHQSADDINFAIRLTSGKKAVVVEDGVVKAKIKYKPGNVFRISVDAGVVNYYKNGSIFYTSASRPVYPLLVNASLVNRMATVNDVMMAGASLSTVVSISPAKTNLRTNESLQFTALVTGPQNPAVNWTASRGTITSAGLYTAPSTAGTYTVRATSAADPNAGASATVTVNSAADNKPPAISSVTSSNITATGVIISWVTDEPSDTTVEYGPTTAYGSVSTTNAQMVTLHSVAFGGLAPGTLYNFRVRSIDSSGNKGYSGNFTFTTTEAADTTPPVISSISATSVTTSGATINWATNEASDTQVEYGATTSYGAVTSLTTAMVTSHSASLSGLASATTYQYRVRSRDAAGNLAVSANQSFTTSSTGSGGGTGARQNVVWASAVNLSVTGNSLRKVSGRGDVADAGARSQQVLQSGDGYIEFSTSDTDKIKFIGFSRNPDGTEFETIDFCIKFNNIGIAEVRESNAYQTERAFVPGDVFRIAIEGGVVKYYKNGSVFHTSTKAPQYPLTGDTSLIGMNATINNAVIAATGNGVLALASDHSPPLLQSGHLAIGGNAASTSPGGLIRRQRAIRFLADEAEIVHSAERRHIALLSPLAGWRLNRNDAGNSFINSRNRSGRRADGA